MEESIHELRVKNVFFCHTFSKFMILKFIKPVFLQAYNVKNFTKFLKIDHVISHSFYVTRYDTYSLFSSACIPCIIPGGLCLTGGIDKKEFLISGLLSEFSSSLKRDICSLASGLCSLSSL